jgi:hypothetical protein
MEVILVDAIIESVIIAVRKDLINCLVETECCRWSKRKIKKLLQKLQKHADDEQSIEEAKMRVRQSIAHLSQPPSLSSLSYDDREVIPSDSLKPDSIIHQFVKQLSLI